MAKMQQRAFERCHCQKEIEYYISRNLEGFSGEMGNISQGGMYFETKNLVGEEDEIYIFVKGDPQSDCVYEHSPIYKGRIRWLKPIPGNKDERFGVGVQFI